VADGVLSGLADPVPSPATAEDPSGTARLGPLCPTSEWPEKRYVPRASPESPTDRASPRVTLSTVGTQRSRIARRAVALLRRPDMRATLQPRFSDLRRLVEAEPE